MGRLIASRNSKKLKGVWIVFHNIPCIKREDSHVIPCIKRDSYHVFPRKSVNIPKQEN